MVGTRGHVGDEQRARLEGAQLILSGDDVPLPARPASARAVHQELTRIMSSDDLWSPVSALFPGGSTAQAAVLDGFSVGYCLVGEGAVFVAAVGVGPDSFRIRAVRDWTAYDHDATTAFPLSDLKS